MAQTRKVSGVATSIRTENDVTKVRYHSTDVVSFNNEVIELNTGGWFTSTTKARMNQASNQFNLGFCVYQDKHQWFVNYKNTTHPFNGSKMVLNRLAY